MADLLVVNVVLIDGTGRPPVAGARVVVEDGLIAAVDGRSDRPAGATVIEGRGRWLVPGLWDTHVHAGFSAGGFVQPEEFSEEQQLLNWRGYLRSGITSVVSVGDDPAMVTAARAREADGTLVGPRIFASGSVLTAPGGHPISTILHGPVSELRDVAVGIEEPTQGRRTLQRLVADYQVDVVKVVYSTIPGDVPRLDRQVLVALVREAHALGRSILAHVSTPEEAADCIDAGVDGLEHMVIGDAEVLESVFAAAAEREVFWTPTLCLFDKFDHDGDDQFLRDYQPDGTVSRTVLDSLHAPGAWWRAPDDRSSSPPWMRTVEFVGRAHAAGVPVALGTDAGNPAIFHGLSVHRELQLLVRAGLTPMQALTAATRTAAGKAGAERRLGTIQPGKEADLVVLGAGPLEDIRHTRSVELVVKRGVVFDPAELTVR